MAPTDCTVRPKLDPLGRYVGNAAFEAEQERWLTTNLDLDPMGRVTVATDPAGRTVEFDRDASGQSNHSTVFEPNATTTTTKVG